MPKGLGSREATTLRGSAGQIGYVVETTSGRVKKPAQAGRGAWWPPAVLATAIVLVVLMMANAPSAEFALVTIGTSIAGAAEIWTLSRRCHGFTPAALIVAIVLSVSILGAYLYDNISSEAAVSADLATDSAALQTAVVIAFVFCTCVTAGALLATVGQREAQAPLSGIRLPKRPLLIAGYLSLFLLVLGRGRALIYAPYYLDSSGPRVALIIGTSTAAVGALALCVAFFQERSSKWIAGMGITGFAIAHFAVATRQLALLPALILAGYLLAPSSEKKRVGPVKVTAVVAATIFLIHLVLYLRASPYGVGISPFLRLLQENPHLFAGFKFSEIFGNILFATPLTATVANLDVSLAAFFTSINPLPSTYTDWPTLLWTLRINYNTPYNGLGELRAVGWTVLVIYATLVGAIFTTCMRIARSLAPSAAIVTRVLIIALTTLYSLDLLQYNLRSGTRLVWYALAFLGILYVYQLVRGHPKNTPQGESGGTWAVRS